MTDPGNSSVLRSFQEYDLSTDANRERADKRSNIGGSIAIIAGFGASIAILGMLGLTGVVLATPLEGWSSVAVGRAIILGSTYWIRSFSTNEIVRLRVDDMGIVFVRSNGSQDAVPWSDPLLEVDLLRLEADCRSILHDAKDARWIRPTWIDVWNHRGSTVRIETTVPLEALTGIAGEAEEQPVHVSCDKVTFFWGYGGPDSPGELHYRDGRDLHAGDRPNGEIWKLRGPNAPPRRVF